MCPDDRRDAGARDTEGENGIGDLFRIVQCVVAGLTGRKLEPLPGGIVVRLAREIGKRRVAAREVLAEVVRNGKFSILPAENTPQQRDTIGRELMQVQVMTAGDASEQAWRQLLALLLDGRVALTEGEIPPGVILATVAAGNTPMPAHGEEHPAAGRTKLFRDLCARIARTDHENRTWRQLLRIAVSAGMQVQSLAADRDRSYRHLERPGGDHHVPGFDCARRRLDEQALQVRRATQQGCRHTATQRRANEVRVALDESDDFLARRKRVRIGSRKLKARQANVPVRTLERERVPSLAPPTLGHALPFENDMLASALAEVVA